MKQIFSCPVLFYKNANDLFLPTLSKVVRLIEKIWPIFYQALCWGLQRTVHSVRINRVE